MTKGHPVEKFVPYANESDVLTLGDLVIENRVDRLSLQGDVELTRDKRGLVLAKQLQTVIDATVKALEAESHLPDEVPVQRARTVRNPFA